MRNQENKAVKDKISKIKETVIQTKVYLKGKCLDLLTQNAKAIFFQLGGKATRAGFDSAQLKKTNEPKELDFLPPHNHD